MTFSFRDFLVERNDRILSFLTTQYDMMIDTHENDYGIIIAKLPEMKLVKGSYNLMLLTGFDEQDDQKLELFYGCIFPSDQVNFDHDRAWLRVKLPRYLVDPSFDLTTVEPAISIGIKFLESEVLNNLAKYDVLLFLRQQSVKETSVFTQDVLRDFKGDFNKLIAKDPAEWSKLIAAIPDRYCSKTVRDQLKLMFLPDKESDLGVPDDI